MIGPEESEIRANAVVEPHPGNNNGLYRPKLS